MLVTICVITYQRPEGLKRLMHGLNQLTFDRIPQPQIRVALVDNDATGSVGDFCEQWRSSFQWHLDWVTESQRGISYARNRAIATADPSSDFIAFIDDDEVPDPTWLEELLLVQSTYNADVVHGRVVPHFQDKVPAWVVKGKFFEPRRYPTGHSLEAAYTNNALVRATLLRQQDKVFDERFALTGGEDSYFFRTLRHQGHRLVWADEAVVCEWIPPSRTTMKWILLRAYRGCLSYTLWEKETLVSVKVRTVAVLKAIAQIALGLVLLLPSLVLERHILMRALLNIYKGAGRLSALIGVTYQEYKTVHGV
ncbi:MAG: glycosyltransferase family 2 protein [Leptolyngbyaceae cyanobacterium SL_7_1]|nr:glycosyltransferase family 2 protein [Leptolyngbyaceae cyanobacterium SL_7_1]